MAQSTSAGHSDSGDFQRMKHSKPDDKGNPVQLLNPHSCTGARSWSDPTALATAVPGCDLPAEINGIELRPWPEALRSACDWGARGDAGAMLLQDTLCL